MDLVMLSASVAIAGLAVSLAQLYSAWGRDTQAYITLIMDFRIDIETSNRSIIQQDLKRCLILEHVATRFYNPKILRTLLSWEAGHFALRFCEMMKNELPFRLLEESDKGNNVIKEISDIEYGRPASDQEFREKVELAMSNYYYGLRDSYPEFCKLIDRISREDDSMRYLDIWNTYSHR
jgi:hypothetical protein